MTARSLVRSTTRRRPSRSKPSRNSRKRKRRLKRSVPRSHARQSVHHFPAFWVFVRLISANICPAAARLFLQSLDPIYVNFGLPQQDAGQVHAGQTVRITTENL